MKNSYDHQDKLVDDENPKLTCDLCIGVLIAVLGASFQYGYNIAVVNAPADEVKEFFFPLPEEYKSCTNESNTTIQNICLKKEDFTNYQDNMYAIAVSAFAASGMVGSLLVGPIVKRFGRLGGLMVNNFFSFASAICLGVSKPASSFALLCLGRVFIGIFAGLATGVVPMYIGEISPKQWRGAIGVLNQLFITIGILVAQIFGLKYIMGNDILWPILFAFTCVPSAISTICYPVMPKSPRFLLIDRSKEQEAKEVLIKLRGTDNVETEIAEMKTEAADQRSAGQLSIPQLFRDRSIRWQLITILLLMMAQQLSGINAVFFYSNKIFESAGIKDSEAQDIASVIVGIVNVLMTIISVVLIDRAGRKMLLVGGFGFMVLWCLALTILLNVLLDSNEELSSVSYLSIGCIIGYIIGFAVGPGPIPWLITTELFRQAARPAAAMVSCLVNWTCNFIVGISFPAVANFTGAYVFIGFMVVCILITVYLYFVLPETKNKTFQEINEMFAKRNKVSRSSIDRDNSQKVPLQVMESKAEVEEDDVSRKV